MGQKTVTGGIPNNSTSSVLLRARQHVARRAHKTSRASPSSLLTWRRGGARQLRPAPPWAAERPGTPSLPQPERPPRWPHAVSTGRSRAPRPRVSRSRPLASADAVGKTPREAAEDSGLVPATSALPGSSEPCLPRLGGCRQRCGK